MDNSAIYINSFYCPQCERVHPRVKQACQWHLPGDTVSWNTEWTAEEEWDSWGVIVTPVHRDPDLAWVMETHRTSACGQYTKYIGEITEVFMATLCPVGG